MELIKKSKIKFLQILLWKEINVKFDNNRYRCTDRNLWQKIKDRESNVSKNNRQLRWRCKTSITLYETIYGLIKFKKPFYHLSSFRVYEFSKGRCSTSSKFGFRFGEKWEKDQKNGYPDCINNNNQKRCNFVYIDNEFQKLEELELRLFQ